MRTVVKGAFDDGHFGIDDLGPALQHGCRLQSIQQVLQQISQAVALAPVHQYSFYSTSSIAHLL